MEEGAGRVGKMGDWPAVWRIWPGGAAAATVCCCSPRAPALLPSAAIEASMIILPLV